MDRCLRVLFVVLIYAVPLRAQTITLSSPVIFDTVLVNTNDSLAFWVRNAGPTPFVVTDINTTRPEFRVKDTLFTVQANDSVRVYVYFKTNQNVTWKDILVVVGVGGGTPLRLSGIGRYPDASYNSTQGLWDNALKTALTNLVINHTSLGYNTARDRMFETIDDVNLTDTIECVYIARRIRAVTRTEAQNQNFNTEHTWPQSFFADEPMVSDLNHLFPTDAVPNSNRANYPFGPVVSNITYNVAGSKLGQRANGALAFEPRDVHKGDVARALFYFMVRYGNLGNYMDATQENDLRVWHKFDPVSAKENQRNTRVASYQGKKNPLIDHPEFVDRIAYFYTTSAPTLFPDITTSATSINFGTIAASDSVEWKLIIINNGRASLNVTGLILQSPSSNFRIIDAPASVPVDSFRQVRLRFTPTQANLTFNNTLVIQSSDPDEGTVNIPLTGTTNSGFAQVQLQSPPDQAHGIPSPVQFVWRSSPGAIAYHIEVSANSSFATVLASDSTLNDTTDAVSGLDTVATHYWRVRAKNGATWGSFSTVWQFQIAAELTVTSQMNTGWNIVSVPVTAVNPSVTSLFPNALSAAFAYQNGYTQSDTLISGSGYWLKLGSSQPVSILGQPISSDTIEVNAGWNLVGSISYPVTLASVASIPPGIIVSSFFGFDNGYASATTLLPMKGYWVRCSQQGQIIFQGE